MNLLKQKQIQKENDYLFNKLVNENNRLVQDNLDLDRLYRRTAEKLKENTVKDKYGRTIKTSDNTQLYLYAVFLNLSFL